MRLLPDPELIELTTHLPQGGKVLDLGCGTGRQSIYLARLGHKVIAVDQNLRSLLYLNQVNVKEELNIQIVKQDLLAYLQQAAEERYDLILFTLVLNYFSYEEVMEIITITQQMTNFLGYHMVKSFLPNPDQEKLNFRSFLTREDYLRTYQGWKIKDIFNGESDKGKDVQGYSFWAQK